MIEKIEREFLDWYGYFKINVSTILVAIFTKVSFLKKNNTKCIKIYSEEISNKHLISFI